MSAIALTLPLTTVIRAGASPALQGEPSDGVQIVQSGVLLSDRLTTDGRRLAELLGPGDSVGEPAGSSSPVTTTAIRPCRLRPAHHHEVGESLAVRAARALAFAHELAWLTVPERLERRLHDAAARFGRPVPGGLAVGVRLTQEDLAALVGCTRESTNRAVAALVASGRIRKAGRGRYVMPAARFAAWPAIRAGPAVRSRGMTPNLQLAIR